MHSFGSNPSLLARVATAALVMLAPLPAGETFDIPLRIDMGGPEVHDSLGRLWLGDRRDCTAPAAEDPLGIRPDDHGGTQAFCDWLIEQFDQHGHQTLEDLGFDPLHSGDRTIFNSIRWDFGLQPPDFMLDLPVPNGTYSVRLWFIESCCPERHFQIELQDELVAADVSYLDYAAEPALGRPGWLEFEDVEVSNGSLHIALLPCPDCPGVVDVNPIVAAIEVLSGSTCGHDGLDLEGQHDPGGPTATLRWRTWPDVASWRVRRDGEIVTDALDAATLSWVDETPAALPRHTYQLDAIDTEGTVLATCWSTVAMFSCPNDLSCQWVDESDSVHLSWDPGAGEVLQGFEVRRGDEVIATLDSDAAEFTDSASSERIIEYVVVPITEPPDLCNELECSVFGCREEPWETPLRINLGGHAVTDSLGREWLADNPSGIDDTLGDPLCIRPDDAGAAHSFARWCPLGAEAFDLVGLDSKHAGDAALLSSMRWDDGTDAAPFALEMALRTGRYDVSLWFAECCCPARHFSVLLEGDVVDPDVHHEPLTSSRRIFERVEVLDGALDIELLPCVQPECPDGGDLNTILTALEVSRYSAPFHRGDPTGDGGTNITDAIAILSWLFSGGEKPACVETADVDDNSSVNLSDAILILGFLFQGGTPPAPPGPPDSECGDDPDDSPAHLGCDLYEGC